MTTRADDPADDGTSGRAGRGTAAPMTALPRRAALGALALALACTGDGPAEPAWIEGRVQRLVAGDPDRGRSAVGHLLEQAGEEEIELVLPAGPAPAAELPTGAHVALRGRWGAPGDPAGPLGRERRFVVEQVVRRGAASSRALVVDPAAPPAPRTLAVVLLNFQNDDREPISVDEARARVFSDPRSSRSFLREQSFGFVDVQGRVDPANGDVLGWYTVPYNNRPCRERAWGDAALKMAAEAGVPDPTGYDHYVFLFPFTDGCDYAGLAQQPGKLTWVNGASLRVTNHEIGHNFGTPHAASLSCTGAGGERVTLSDDCAPSEYGNPFDIMGRAFRHTNAFNKARARWLGGANVERVTRDGVYTLLPQERPSAGLQLLGIPRDERTSYWLEFRRPFGFDDFPPDAPAVRGVMVLLGGRLDELSTSYLLDGTPATPTFADAPLAAGARFVDPDGKATITVLEVGDEAATVKVEFPGGRSPGSLGAPADAAGPPDAGGAGGDAGAAGAGAAGPRDAEAPIVARPIRADGGPAPDAGRPLPRGGGGCALGGAGRGGGTAAGLPLALALVLLGRGRRRR